MNTGNVHPAQRALLPDTLPAAAPRRTGAAPGAAFPQVLAEQQAAQSVRFSKHARNRLERRQIDLTPERLERLDNAIARARARGARESLVLLDDVALVVSIRHQTVITATSAASRGENVFTNIDSAVIA